MGEGSVGEVEEIVYQESVLYRQLHYNLLRGNSGKNVSTDNEGITRIF